MEKAVYGEGPYLCPYVIRFQDSTALSIPEKQMKKVIKRLKRIPVEQIEFVGFELEHIGNMLDDEGALQQSQATGFTIMRNGIRLYITTSASKFGLSA